MARRRKATPAEQALAGIRKAKLTATGGLYRALHESETKVMVGMGALKKRSRLTKDQKTAAALKSARKELAAAKKALKKKKG